MVLLLLLYCLMYLRMFVGELCWSLFWYALLCVLSSLEIILTRDRERLFCFIFFWFLVTDNVPWLLLTVLWVGLQCVILVFPDHTHLLFQCELLSVECYLVNMATTCSVLHYLIWKFTAFDILNSNGIRYQTMNKLSASLFFHYLFSLPFWKCNALRTKTNGDEILNNEFLF